MATNTVTSTVTTVQPRILSVAKSSSHTISKVPSPSITLVTGLGVQGDCHSGASVQHQALRQTNPSAPNLRQVHLIPMESLQRVSAKLNSGTPLSAGEVGENITTEGIDLTTLSRGTELHFVLQGESSSKAVVVLAGLREPGPGLDKCRPGLKGAFDRRLAGVMATVKQGGTIKPGMRIDVVRPARTEPLLAV
ncbi:pyruvate kinase-like protein [Aspergillus granulosus]|uniref:Pyruvate kinase-like protein n=1 Tax=Aspergillus granulosus TaxID=176169 RepID=A0ABR4GYR3_9EURO